MTAGQDLPTKIFEAGDTVILRFEYRQGPGLPILEPNSPATCDVFVYSPDGTPKYYGLTSSSPEHLAPGTWEVQYATQKDPRLYAAGTYKVEATINDGGVPVVQIDSFILTASDPTIPVI